LRAEQLVRAKVAEFDAIFDEVMRGNVDSLTVNQRTRRSGRVRKYTKDLDENVSATFL
jgi:hypothetical protein